MATDERKPCVFCHRTIDAAARVCAYCNREQTTVASISTASSTAVPSSPLPPSEIQPPQERVRKREIASGLAPRVFVVVAIAVLLMAVFAVGGLVYSLGRKKETPDKPAVVSAEPAPRSRRSYDNLTLVTESAATTTIDRAITTSPVEGAPGELPLETQRSDATALPSTVYSKILDAERVRPVVTASSTDPRSIIAPPPPQRAQPVERPPAESPPEPAEPAAEPRETRSQRTRPRPLEQPLPDIRADGTVRLVLTVGADGRVKEIEVVETIAGKTSEIISAVQRWRFKPSLENGVPVEGQFPVDISFTDNE